MSAALSIRAVHTPPGATPPYADGEGPDGLLRYKYRGDDPEYPENRALRRAYAGGLPLIWFVGVAKARHQPVYPVWIEADEPNHLQFAIALDEGQRGFAPGKLQAVERRRYVERLNMVRLYQPMFRAWVLDAYRSRCAVCRLAHAGLLDAAHIIADGTPHGDPVVPNGLAICKIHHAAFAATSWECDRTCRFTSARTSSRRSTGPMLRHGLREMNNVHLVGPSSRQSRPDKTRLEEHYAEFLSATA